MFRKTLIKTLVVALSIMGFASTAFAHKLQYWFGGSDVGITVRHNLYEGFLFNDTHSQSKDFSKLEPNVPNWLADDYEFKLNVYCNGVWQGWSPQFISAELGWNVHDYCPAGQVTGGGATYMGEK